jgi:hypothetical protein
MIEQLLLFLRFCAHFPGCISEVFAQGVVVEAPAGAVRSLARSCILDCVMETPSVRRRPAD